MILQKASDPPIFFDTRSYGLPLTGPKLKEALLEMGVTTIPAGTVMVRRANVWSPWLVFEVQSAIGIEHVRGADIVFYIPGTKMVMSAVTNRPMTADDSPTVIGMLRKTLTFRDVQFPTSAEYKAYMKAKGV